MRAGWILVCAVLLFAVARPAVSSRAAAAEAVVEGQVPALPATLSGQVGREQPMDASETLLAAIPGVSLQSRAYGRTQASLVTSRGLRENHPPAVCLKAGGFELMQRREEQAGEHCLVHLTVRREAVTSHHVYTYLAHLTPGGDGGLSAGRCGFWRQVAHTAWRKLTGQPGAWSTLQVMDSDAARARAAILNLLRRIR